MDQQTQVDANKVIESLTRQISEYAQKVAIMEAYIDSLKADLGNEKAD
jgi:hypothetical protein